MFCKECGVEIPEGSKYCPECGAKLAESPPAQQAVGIGCYACGQTAVGQCPECGRFYCREHGEEGLCALCAAGRLRKLAWVAGAFGAFAGFTMSMCVVDWIWKGTDVINALCVVGGLGAIVGGYLAFRYVSRFGFLGIAIASLGLAFGSCWTWYWPGSVISSYPKYGRSEAEAMRKIWTTLPVGWGIIILIVGGSLWLFRRREK